LGRTPIRGRPDDAHELLFDSGAFSAWGQEDAPPLNLQEYIDYVRRNERWLRLYVNLDVICGERGRKRSTEALRESARLSDANLQRMLDAGLEPIPVFHEGEDWRWLEKMVRDGRDYIGLAPVKPLRGQSAAEFLEPAFDLLKGTGIHTHGFGITKPEWLLNPKFTFTSVDSTTWALGAGYGTIYVPPRGDDGVPNYAGLPSRVVMSGREQGSASLQRSQFDALDPDTQDYVIDYVTAAGFKMVHARYSPAARRLINLRYFIELTKHLPSPVTVFYATQIERNFADPLAACNARHQLLSYFKLKGRSDEVLRRYVEFGELPPTQERVMRFNARKAWRDRSYWDRRALQLAERLARYEAEERAG
jgi:hypothetical protein